jgi:hypothetical protein
MTKANLAAYGRASVAFLTNRRNRTQREGGAPAWRFLSTGGARERPEFMEVIPVILPPGD